MPRYGMAAPPGSRRRWIPALAAVLLLGFAISGARAELPTGELRVADQTLTVEIAATPQAMARGLMFREHMPESRGMLFIWPGDQVVAMWMKNTLIPLSVAFIDRDFRVLNIANMEPRSLRTHPSHGPARYALEVNEGWFARHGVAAGTRIDDLERLVTDLASARH